MSDERPLSTGEVARLLHVTPVAVLCKTGTLLPLSPFTTLILRLRSRSQRVGHGADIRKERFTALKQPLHVLRIELCKGHVVALLAITEQAVVQFPVFPGYPPALNDLAVEGRPNSTMLPECVSLFEEQGAYGIEQGVVGAVHGAASAQSPAPNSRLAARRLSSALVHQYRTTSAFGYSAVIDGCRAVQRPRGSA